MTIRYRFTASHKFWRIERNHQAWLGFWYATDGENREIAVNLFGRTIHI